MAQPVLESFDLGLNEEGVESCRNLSFRLEMGERVLLVTEPAGLGRRLLRVWASLEEPSAGRMRWLGQLEGKMALRYLSGLRRNIGWVHRQSRLVSNMTILENTVLGITYHQNISIPKAYLQVKDLLERFGLDKVRDLRPAEVTYEQDRRALYVRELAKRPRIFLFETPLLDLDDDFGLVMDEVQSRTQAGRAAVVISHLPGKEGDKWPRRVMDAVSEVLVVGRTAHRRLAKEEFLGRRSGPPAGGEA